MFDERDRTAFGLRFGRVSRGLGWIAHATCLMDTHWHGIVETPVPNLGTGMGRLQGGHARWLNERHDHEGHVFRHRFWSTRIADEAHLFRACLYVVLNPVAAGACAHPRDWPHCSYSTTAFGDPNGYAPGEERLLRMFGDTPREARRGYREVVDRMAAMIRSTRIANGRGLWSALQQVQARGTSRVPG